ncbi:hypothetical protein RF55_5470 [Lasius niger]|uniref:Uncharacterized protein n=1 Tax=Lasius niger TaxID=67767 RepID=A0A0J7KVQ6_LASNI|nr:hypothetical protein RF55_5470 [Lasius niger]
MSLLLNPAESAYLNDNETENLFLSEDESEDYNFKYVPANRFKYIVKDVRRQRCREEEENVWASFVKQQELNGYDKNGIHPSVQSIKQLLDEGMKEADKELKKLETDILPDKIKKECGRTGNNQKKRLKVNNIRDLTTKKMPVTRDTATGSTNLLLTIPEEENISAYEKKQEPEHFKSYVRKSRSGHAISRKKQPSLKQLHRTTNDVEYNSSPESSARRDDVADGVIHVRPDPFIMHKILTMQRKVCELLDEITFRLGNIPPPDGIKDLQRRQQCVSEFVIRFSRNYLYDLNRYVKDIQRHMCIISPRAVIRPNHRSLGLHMHAIEHKLLASHQLLLHALVAYCKHIPSSILKGHPGKFREILQVVIDLKTMCDRLHLNYLDSGDTDILSLPYASSVTSSKATNQISIIKHRTYAKEEDIKTMMDMLPIDSDNCSNFETQEKHDAMLTRRVTKASRKFSDNLQDSKQSESIENIVKNTTTNNDDELVKKVTMITEEHLSSLVPIIADLMSFVSNKKYESPMSTNISCDICPSSLRSNCECEHLKTNRTLAGTRKNGKNMRLICMSSIENASKVPRYCDVSCQANCESLTELSDFEIKMKEEKRRTNSSNNIELIVSEETEINFLKYRREYLRLIQSVPMYSSNTQNKPWDIVAWISDKLVDELIMEISKELQIDDVIQKLFELEFQEF